MACRRLSWQQERGVACSGWNSRTRAFLGHEMRGAAGTGRGGVSMVGGWEGQGTRKEMGVKIVCHHRHVLFRICLCISAFCLDEEGC